MSRVLSLLLAVAALWVGLEVYNNGLDGAFGGRLAALTGDRSSEAPRASAPQRAGAAVERAHAVASERREKLLTE